MFHEMTSNSKFQNLSEKEALEVNGGGIKEKAVSFICDYIISKGIDWVISNKSKIWKNFKAGPAANDPMRQTDFYKIFSTTIK